MLTPHADAEPSTPKCSIPDNVRACIGGFDVASRPILGLVDRFGGKVFSIKETNRPTEVRVLAFTRREAEEFVNEKSSPNDILVFPGQTETVQPPQPLNLAELATSLPDAYEHRLKRLLVDVSNEVAKQTNLDRLGSRKLTSALVAAIDERCELILEAAAISEAKVKAYRDAKQIRLKAEESAQQILLNARQKATALLKSERTIVAAELKSSRQRLRWLKKELTNTDSMCWQHHYPPVPQPMAQAGKLCEAVPMASGIYFVWSEGRVVYVGQSTNIFQRCGSVGHHAISFGEMISWIEQPVSRLNFAESFYIGITKPERNFGVRAQRWQ